MASGSRSVFIALLMAVICSVQSEETVHETGLHSADDINSNTGHQAQKRMSFSSPAEEDDGLVLTNEGLVDPLIANEYLDKRGSLFRFGKRQGSLFRFGKRGSLFRFGKRQGGTLFRFGKRGGTLFRFGRSDSAQNPLDSTEEDKRTLFRFGKRSDIDQLAHILAQYEYENKSPYLDIPENKRGIDSFHWGSDSE